MNTLENVKQWFIDRDLENGGRLDKQSLKLIEEFGELCAGYLKKNEQLTKDSIGDCAVVIVGLVLLSEVDVDSIFEVSKNVRNNDMMTFFAYTSICISNIQAQHNLKLIDRRTKSLTLLIGYLKSISNAFGYDFEECFELAYQEIKDRKGRWIDGTFVKEEDLG